MFNTNNNHWDIPYFYGQHQHQQQQPPQQQQQQQPPCAVPVHVPMPVPFVGGASNVNLNLMNALAQPNFNGIPPPCNMNYMQPCSNQMMPPLYAYNPPAPMPYYTQPIYNLPPNNPGINFFNGQQGYPHFPPIMPPNGPYCGPQQMPNFMPPPPPGFQSHVDPNFNKENINPETRAPTQSQSTQTIKNHVYLNGMLYNTELLAPEPDEADDQNPKEPTLDEEEENYDPSADQPPPSIYGLRFYNPFYGPEGAIPKPSAAKVKPLPKIRKQPGPPESLANGLPHFKGLYSQLALHRLAHADFYGSQAQAVARDILHKNQMLKNQQQQDGEKQGQQQDLDKKVGGDTVRRNNNKTSNNHNNKSKSRIKSKQRRQGRNRTRGFTQSFGIVAPVKRDCPMPTENVEAAKNVLSLFDTKHTYKKWPLDDIDMDMDKTEDWTPFMMDDNNNDTFYNDS